MIVFRVPHGAVQPSGYSLENQESKSLIRKSQFVALMQDSFDFQSLVKKYPELPYALFAILSYTISVIFAITEWGSTSDFYGIDPYAIWKMAHDHQAN